MLSSYSKEYVYDTETIKITVEGKTNYFFCCCFKNEEESYVFEISKRKNQVREFFEFFDNPSHYYYAYNNGRYDSRIINSLREQYGEGTINIQRLSQFSDSIIKSDEYYEPTLKNETDLMTLNFQYKAQKSLKMVGVMLFHENIQDLPLDLNKDYTQAEFLELANSIDELYDKIIDYCFEDCAITLKLKNQSKGKIKIRENIFEAHKLDCRSDYDSTISRKLFKLEYPNLNKTLKNKRLNPIINVRNLIPNDIKLNSKSGINVYEKLKNTVIKDNSFEYIFHSELMTHTIGEGGIHSNNNGSIFKSDDKFTYIDGDVESYYPRVIINWEICPSHLDKKIFIQLLTRYVDTRINSKRLSKDQLLTIGEREFYAVSSDRLKILINAIYGLMGMESSELCDTEARLKVCIICQLLMIDWVERCELEGIYSVISNTDGIVFKVPNDKIELFKSISSEVESQYRIKFEYTNIEAIYMLNCNSYILIKQGKEDVKYRTKVKGLLLTTIQLDKGYNTPIIANSVYNYFIYNTPIEQFIKSDDRTIYEFLTCVKFDKFAKVESHILKDNNIVIKTLQKTNRWYYSNYQSKIFKVDTHKGNKRMTDVSANYKVSEVNRIDNNKPIKEYNINYHYYVSQARKLIKKMIPDQLNLYDTI